MTRYQYCRNCGKALVASLPNQEFCNGKCIREFRSGGFREIKQKKTGDGEK